MTKRRRAREMAVQMLYQSDLGEAPVREVIAGFDPLEVLAAHRAAAAEEEEAETGEAETGEARGRKRSKGKAKRSRAERPEALAESFDYAERLVRGTLEHRDELDALIREQAENWRLERMPAVDRNILRLAVYEMLFEEEVPKLVVLDEAIELAKKYGSERSGPFVNGLLDGLLKSHSFPGPLT